MPRTELRDTCDDGSAPAPKKVKPQTRHTTRPEKHPEEQTLSGRNQPELTGRAPVVTAALLYVFKT